MMPLQDGRAVLTPMPPGTADVPTFRCPQCGATQRFDPAARALVCPFCGTPVVMAARASASSDLQVDQRLTIPFIINQAQSLALLRAWLGNGFFAPNDLTSRAAPDSGRGVYIPFFLFECMVSSDWTGAYSETRYRTRTYTDAQGHTQTEEQAYTVWHPESGCHTAYQRTLITASTGLTQAEADAVLPFALRDAQHDAPAYFAGFAAEQPQMAGEKAWEKGAARIQMMERTACAALTERLRSVDTTVQQRLTSLVWLPIWVYVYTYHNTAFRVVVNGQTGAVQGQRPLSGMKVAVVVISLLSVLILLLLTIVLKTR